MIGDVMTVLNFQWQCMLLGSVLFGLGLVGFISRRNLIIMFLSTEVMLQGVLVNLLGLNTIHQALNGQSFALFVLVIAAVEAAVALGMIVLLFRRRATLDSEAWKQMGG